jgi:antitoxin component of MazEF toxin-antitoxin module
VPDTIELRAVIQRKSETLPRFVVIPAKAVEAWHLAGTTTVDLQINGTPAGRRSLTVWDAKKWFIGIPETLCKAANVDTGSRVTLRFSVADSAMPNELRELVERDAAARSRWESLTPAQQRMLRENVAAGKAEATRRRRAEAELRSR